MIKVQEDLIRSLMAQRVKINKKLTSWNDKNFSNSLLESQLANIDSRIDYLLTTKGGE